MKVKLHKIGLGLVASVTLLAAASTAHAMQDLYVQCGSGGPVKDPYGKCVLSIGGAALPGCQVAAVSEPPPPVKPVIETITLGADALFDFDRATLKPAGRARLDQLVSDMRRVQSVSSIGIVGHTDSKGSDAYNQRLSERRAATVKNYLIEQGVNPAIVTARGEGERNPVAPNTTPQGRDNPAGRAQNRRVEVSVEASDKLRQQ